MNLHLKPLTKRAYAIKLTLLLASILLLSACGDSNEKDDKPKMAGKNGHAEQQEQVYTVKSEQTASRLFFNGTIQPLNTHKITAPVDGVVSKMNFHYGQQIEKGRFLLEIDSKKMEEAFKNAVKDYLNKKNRYTTDKAKFTSNQVLFDDGLISRNDFEASKTSKETAELDFNQARNTLNDELTKIKRFHKDNELLQNVSQLTLGSREVDQILLLDFSNIDIYSDAKGVALFASSKQGEAGSAKAVAIGAEVKQGQVLVSLGNLKGLSMIVYVNEVSINKVRPGQPVTVTGVAFPGIVLHGKVDDVDSQAKSDQGGGLPVFAVRVVVPDLTKQQRKIIHVGMSSKITITLKSPEQLMIPISAVHNKEGKPYVNVIGADGKLKEVSVETGQTTARSIVVTKGLKSGDKIALGH